MGCSISMLKNEDADEDKEVWEDITPGGRSRMASLLYEISGCGGDSEMLFSRDDVPRLEEGKQAEPGLAQCFDAILARIREHGRAVVKISW